MEAPIPAQRSPRGIDLEPARRHIERDLKQVLEAVANGYALTLSALMLLGGALGDRYQRSHVFAAGLIGFAVACAGCAFAPDALALIAWRVVQGVCGALLVPNSLAMLEAAFTGAARGAAIGQWSAWSTVSTAVGPLFGGWMVDRASWRSVFAIMIPFALGAAWIALRHDRASEAAASRERAAGGGADYIGAALITVAFACIVGALTLATRQGLTDPRVLNNTVARPGGLLATAAIPLAAGVHGSALTDAQEFTAAFTRAMWISAGLCASGTVVAWISLGRSLVQPGNAESTAFASPGETVGGQK